MRPAPDDIANLCALFTELKVRYLKGEELIRRTARILRMDSGASPSSVIGEALACRVIRRKKGGYFVTEAGVAVGKAQGSCKAVISELAKRALLLRVYLNTGARTRCCGEFLAQWQTDSFRGTFIFRRDREEKSEVLEWLQALERVDLIGIDGYEAWVEQKYLGIVNELLAEIRGVALSWDGSTENFRRKVGEVAEELAVAYERRRLHSHGYGELSALVRRISLVDQSAGYDVQSCRGTGRVPEAPIFLEVKGTSQPDVQFGWTFNEQQVARQKGKAYWIYCYTDVNPVEKSGTGPLRIGCPHKVIKAPEYRVVARDLWIEKVAT